MLNLRKFGSICILVIASQSALPQLPTELKLVDTAPRASKADNSLRAKALSTYRAAELNRHAHDPGTPAAKAGPWAIRAEYSEIVSGMEPLTQEDVLRIKNTKAMPPTSCKSVYLVPKDPKRPTEGPWWAHHSTIALFSSQSGFGFRRMKMHKNSRGQVIGSPGIDRVELVSLMTTDEPSVYVLDEIAEPPKARLARRRPLDEFEQLGLDAVRRGDDLVSTKEAPNRMFGAIRAAENCLECHTGAKKNDLLGAFTYYLETSIDKLELIPRPTSPASFSTDQLELAPSFRP